MAAFDPHVNFGYSTVLLAPSPALSGLTLTVQAGDGAKFPSPSPVAFNAVVWPPGVQPTLTNAEIVRVTSISTDTFTITRQQESSNNRSITIGDQICCVISAKTLTDVENRLITVENLQAKTVTLVDGATPALDASLGDVYRLVALGDRTIGIPTNPKAGQKIIIQHLASGGGRTLALNSGTGGFRFGADITSLSATTSGKTDYIGAVYNDTDNKWDVVAYTKGF